MKKRGIFSVFSVIFVLILMPNAYSIYEELVYSGAVMDDEVVEIADSIFEFKIDSISNKVFIDIDTSGIIVSKGECKIKDNFDICISAINFSHRNHTTWEMIYKALIDVYQIKSTLETTHTIEKNNLLIGEETTAELAIENTADVVAEDVTATINISSSILVTELEGCKKTYNGITFKSNVYPRQIKRCTYKIKGLTGDDFELKANVTYFDGVETKSEDSDTIDVKVYNYSLKIIPKLNKNKFNIGEELNLTVNIENINDEHDLRLTTFIIKIPEKLLLVKKPKDATVNNKIITWSGALAPNENKSFKLGLQGLMTGKYSIPIEATYKISKFLRTAKEVSNIEVYCNCPYLNHEFSQQIAVPDQRVGLKAFIVNPSSVHSFRNVKINYITNIPNIKDFSTVYSKISPFESIKIFDSPITTPDLDEIYYLNITAIYESSSNQVFIVKDKIIIKIPTADENVPTEETIVTEQDEIALVTEELENISDEVEVEKELTDENIQTETLDINKTSWLKSFFKNFDFKVFADQGTYFSFKNLLILFYIFAIITVVLVIIVRFGKKKTEEKETELERIERELK